MHDESSYSLTDRTAGYGPADSGSNPDMSIRSHSLSRSGRRPFKPEMRVRIPLGSFRLLRLMERIAASQAADVEFKSHRSHMGRSHSGNCSGL